MTKGKNKSGIVRCVQHGMYAIQKSTILFCPEHKGFNSIWHLVLSGMYQINRQLSVSFLLIRETR